MDWPRMQIGSNTDGGCTPVTLGMALMEPGERAPPPKGGAWREHLPQGRVCGTPFCGGRHSPAENVQRLLGSSQRTRAQQERTWKMRDREI